MEQIITYTHCPACKSNLIGAVLEAKDYTVSQKLFEIWHCNDCTLRFTQYVANENGIGKYYQSKDYISHSNTKKGIINKLYHFVRSYTQVEKRKFIQKISKKKNGTLLDVGAGTGTFCNTMKKAGWDVTGLEPDETARQNALSNYQLSLQQLNVLHNLPNDAYDIITMWHVLEHVHDIHGYLQTFSKILKKDGVLLIAVPNYTSKDAAWYQSFWAAYDVPRHLYHFSPLSVKQLMKSHGFTVVDTEPMWFDSYYVSMLSEQYKYGSKNIFRLLKAAINGFLSNLPVYFNKEKCSSVIYVIKKK